MLQTESAYVTAHGTKLHYYRTGSGSQPLILIHGITDDSLCWTSVAEALSPAFDIIMVDLRGHGKSEAPDSGYTLENLAKELAGLIQQLGVKQPIIIGHSLGAITSLILAGLNPDLPHAIVLTDPPAHWCFDPSDQDGMEKRKSISDWIQSIKRKTKEELMEEARTKGWSDADQATWVNAKQRASFRVIELVAPPDIPAIDFTELVSRIKCPVLLLQGDISRGAICTEAEIANLKTLYPALQTVLIPEATHSIYRSKFTPFMKAVKEFISEL